MKTTYKTLREFKWIRLYSSIPGSIIIPAGTEVELIEDQYFVKPCVFPEKSIERNDATTYGCRIDANNVGVFTTKQTLNKNVGHNGRVLLGKDSNNICYYLEKPSWDCGWYWGFGYVHSRGSHEHITGFIGNVEIFDTSTHKFVRSDYIHNIYESPRLTDTTFSENEGWQLSELFKQFYLLKDMAAFCHKSRPGCHVTTSPVDHGNMSGWNQHINNVMIPKISAEIMRILSPVKE